MSLDPLCAQDKTLLAQADPAIVQAALSGLGIRAVPPWLRVNHPHQDGSPPRGEGAFAAVADSDLLELIAVRGPLHAMDGWSYLGRSLGALISGDAHAARHLAYYGELRAALSILASSGIGIFNRRNAIVDANGAVQRMTSRPTHEMCWAAIIEWGQLSGNLDRLVEPISVAGRSILEPFREFFPGSASAAAGYLMESWGFDLEQGASDREERNWSSYQLTALQALRTTPSDDAAFVDMFWRALRPGGVELERHLLRILLEAEISSLNGDQMSERGHQYDRLDGQLQGILPFAFLTREDDPYDHQFLLHAANRQLPAHPYAMICRAALLLKLSTGMAEANLTKAGVVPTVHFRDWWVELGIDHGLWAPPYEPVNGGELWDDVDAALEDAAAVPQVLHRRDWTTALAGNALRLCEAERVGLWGLFQ